MLEGGPVTVNSKRIPTLDAAVITEETGIDVFAD
jgi:hypothetical protein